MLRRTLATTAVSAAACLAVTGLAPTATAGPVDDLIAHADCRVVDPLLKATFHIDGNTTRSDLARQIRDAAKPVTGDLTTLLISAQDSEQIADKAVSCGTVKADPEFFPGSSIPNLHNIQDIIHSASSVLPR